MSGLFALPAAKAEAKGLVTQGAYATLKRAQAEAIGSVIETGFRIAALG